MNIKNTTKNQKKGVIRIEMRKTYIYLLITHACGARQSKHYCVILFVVWLYFTYSTMNNSGCTYHTFQHWITMMELNTKFAFILGHKYLTYLW